MDDRPEGQRSIPGAAGGMEVDDSDHHLDLHAYEDEDWSDDENTVADILKGPALETPEDDRLSDLENGEPRFSRTRSTRPETAAPSFARMVADNKQAQKEKRKTMKNLREEDPDHNLLAHNLLTCSTVLQEELGPPRPTPPATAVSCLSYVPASSQDDLPPQLPVSRYLAERTTELSQLLMNGEGGPEAAPTGLKVGQLLQGTKFKVGWYRVPRSEYDSVPATLDPQLKDREVKEPEEDKMALSTICQLEKDTRTLSLVNSFSDILGAVARKLLQESLDNPTMSKEAREGFQAALDLEKSRGKATFHSLSIATALDANLKLIRRHRLLKSSSLAQLDPQVAQAAYRLPFSPSGSTLFGDGEGLKNLLDKDASLSDKKLTRAMTQSLATQLAGQGTRPKAVPYTATQQRGRGQARGKGKGKGRGGNKAPQPKPTEQAVAQSTPPASTPSTHGRGGHRGGRGGQQKS